jgi:hypothetical protein
MDYTHGARVVSYGPFSLFVIHSIYTYITPVHKGLIALTPEMDCDQTAIGLPPVTFVLFLIAMFILATCGIKREW